MAQQQQSKAPDLKDYVEVKERVAEFHKRHEMGILRIRLYEDGAPYKLVHYPGQGGDEEAFIVVVAEGRRAPDEEWFVESAWEPFPGRTPYTRKSELMNANTSALGRVLAAMGIGSDKSMASYEEVRNRQAERDQPAYEQAPPAQQQRARGRQQPPTEPMDKKIRDTAAALVACQSLDALNGIMKQTTPGFRKELVPADVFTDFEGNQVTISRLAVLVKEDMEAAVTGPSDNGWGAATKGTD